MTEGTAASDTYIGQGVTDMSNRYSARLDANGGGLVGHWLAMRGIGNDMTGLTGIGEAITGRDSITGETLSAKERKARLKDGLSTGLAFGATMAIGSPVAGMASRVVTRLAVSSARRLASGARAMGRSLGEALAPTVHPAMRFRMARKGTVLNPFGGKKAQGGVYTLRDPKTGQVMRSGRTRNLLRRERQHKGAAETKGLEFFIEYETNSYRIQRGLEHVLHERHRPPLNKIRPISPYNPLRKTYLRAARDYLRRLDE